MSRGLGICLSGVSFQLAFLIARLTQQAGSVSQLEILTGSEEVRQPFLTQLSNLK